MMNESTPLVSAIVSTYNAQIFIENKIKDLLNQSISDRIQIIIINSGSTQNEHEIIQKYLIEYKNIDYIYTTERESIYSAWNRGIKIAKGKYICNSNTDDRLRRDALEILAYELENSSDVGLVYADQYISTIPNQTFYEIEKKNIFYFPSYNYVHLLDRCLVGSQPMWRASIHFDDDIWFNDKYEICGDHDFEIRVAQKYNLKHLDIVLGTFYKSPEKTNKEYQNPTKTQNEGFSITFYHTQKYINDLSNTDLNKLFWKNIFFALIPFLLYRILNKIRTSLFPKTHFQYPEYTYLLIILIYRKLKDYKKVNYFAKKYLKHTSSKRIQRVKNSIESSEENNKLIISFENEK